MENKPPYLPLGIVPEIKRDSPLLKYCYLCGKESSKLTTEHVIPQLVFAHLEHPVTLRTCSECNHTKKLDEEYVAPFLQCSSFTDVSRQRFDSVLRGFHKGHFPGVRKAMIARLAKSNMHDQDGADLGQVDLIRVEEVRLRPAIERIAKGLWVRNTLKLVDWEEYDIHFGGEQLIQSQQLYESVFKEIWTKGRYGEYWRNTFAYKGDETPDRSHSIWGMQFYGSHHFGVIFERKQQ